MLILITGPAGSGKSTAAKRIASLAAQGTILIIDGCPETRDKFFSMDFDDGIIDVIITCQTPAQWALEYPDVVHLCTPAATDFWQNKRDAAGKTSQPTTRNQ